MRRRNQNRRGNATLEFALVGVPMIFVLISTFSMGFGMWIYHSVGYAVREGTRYAVVHGSDCATPNSCQVTVSQVATRVKSAVPGLDPGQFTLTLTAADGSSVSGTVTTLLANNTTWPPTTCNTPGLNLKIAGSYPFMPIFTLFWPTAGAPHVQTPSFTLGAASTDRIQF